MNSGFDYTNFKKKHAAFEQKRQPLAACRSDIGSLTSNMLDFMIDFDAAVEKSYKTIKSEDLENYKTCVDTAFLAMHAFFDLVNRGKTLTLENEVTIPHETLMICFNDSLKFFTVFSGIIEFYPQHKLKVATDGFTYLNTVISALQVYDKATRTFSAPTKITFLGFDGKRADITNQDEAKKTLEGAVDVNKAKNTLEGAVDAANTKIKNSEINQQRGFKMLVAWFKDFLSDKFEFCAKHLSTSYTTTYYHTAKITSYLTGVEIGGIFQRSKSPSEKDNTVVNDEKPENFLVTGDQNLSTVESIVLV